MLLEIWKSFRSMPTWVQIWVGILLVPINLFSLAFVTQPSGIWIAVLAIGAMAINVPIMFVERGFTKTMALPHILPWTYLVVWLIVARPVGTEAYGTYLLILLITDITSLGFDYPDTINWFRERRKAAR